MAQYWQQSALAISTGRMQVKENQSAQPEVTVVDTERFCIHQQLMELSALDDAAKLKKKTPSLFRGGVSEFTTEAAESLG